MKQLNQTKPDVICNLKNSCKAKEGYCKKCVRNKAAQIRDYFAVTDSWEYLEIERKR